MYIDFKKGYYQLFNAITDAITCIDGGDPQGAKALLVAAHQRTEKLFMEKPDGVGIAFPAKEPERVKRKKKDLPER